MQAVVGLGNPGAEYANTRHNVGFRVLDHLAASAGALWQPRWTGLATQFTADNSADVWLLKPQCYMNRSGLALDAMLEELGEDLLPPENILIVTDDVALPLGQFRLRASGSCGGHNGLASIEAALATRTYPRFRIGVGQQTAPEDLIEFVLGRFEEIENTHLAQRLLPAAADAVRCWIDEGLGKAQERFNGFHLEA